MPVRKNVGVAESPPPPPPPSLWTLKKAQKVFCLKNPKLESTELSLFQELLQDAHWSFDLSLDPKDLNGWGEYHIKNSAEKKWLKNLAIPVELEKKSIEVNYLNYKKP